MTGYDLIVHFTGIAISSHCFFRGPSFSGLANSALAAILIMCY